MRDTDTVFDTEEIVLKSDCNIPSQMSMLRNLRGTKNNIASRRIDILSRFYPYNMLATCNINETNVYGEIAKLAKRLDLEKVDDCHLAARYRLTLQGRCRVLCRILGLKFLNLCTLSEAYAMYKQQMINDCAPSYTIHDMAENFGPVCTPKTIQNAASVLCTKGFADKTFYEIIRIREGTIKLLLEHDDVMNELHEWVVGASVLLKKMALEDPKALDGLRR